MSEHDTGSGTGSALPDLPSRIEEALARRDQIALHDKGRRLTFAVTAAALGPIAVFLLELHVLFPKTPDYQKLSTALIAAELVALISALAISFWRLDQSHYRWLAERLRAELLRREKFLLFARVGPYLGTPQSSITLRVEQRLATIDDDINSPFALLTMAEDAVNWCDALEDSRVAAASAEIPDLAADLHTYLHERIVSQRDWYSQKSLQHGRHARWLEGGSKMTLTLAIVVAAIHLGAPGSVATENLVERFLTVAAVLLPTLGAAFIGLLSIFGCRRLSRSYLYHAHALERLENALRTLQIDAPKSDSQKQVASFQFRRILLETEDLLSDELRLWWLFMHPEAPRSST
jgi:hypothetical protein